MAISNGTRTLSLEDILQYKSEIDIAKFYLNIEDVPCKIASPLREDKNPSFKIDYNENGNIRFYDFGTQNHGGLFDLLMEMTSLDFTSLLNRIYEELIEGKDLAKIDVSKRPKIFVQSKKIESLRVKVREWKEHDLAYWGAGGITKEWLKFGNVYPISRMFIKKTDQDEFDIPCEKHAYVYIEFKDNNPTCKIYQPFSEKYKWINNHDKSVWDLWSKLPVSGDKLIITSSRKDALTIWANTGIPSTCLQAESYLFKENVILEIKSRFKDIYVLYDNDYDKDNNYGHIYGRNISNEYGLTQIEIPSIYKSKDPFALRVNYGKDAFIKIISDLIKK